MTSQLSRSPDSRLGSSTPSNAALQGASLAFAKPTPKPKPQANTYSGRDGAMAAAAKAGSSSPPRNVGRSTYEGSDQPGWKYQTTGGGNVSGRREDQERGRPNRLEPGNGSVYPSKSPSFIAATIAASRSVTPNHTGQQQSSPGQKPNTMPWHPPASVKSLSSSSRESLNQNLDTTPIAPTTSLIDQFEQKLAAPAKLPKESSEFKRTSSSAMQRSHWPPESQKSPLLARRRTPSPTNVQIRKEKPEIKSPKPISRRTFSGEPKPFESPKPLLGSQTPSSLSRRQTKPDISPNLLPTTRNMFIAAPTPVEPLPGPRKIPKTTTKPIPIPPKPRTRIPGDSYASSDDSFVSASDIQPSLPPRRIPAPNHPEYTPSASVESLATAIVASSLASSRAASPSKPINGPPLPPPRRVSHGRIFRHYNDASRTPSPAKSSQLRTTMRKPQQEEVDENDRRRAGRRILMKKHPHKHHEGDRRRWRDEITERERKRYEAVWASNKGLYTSPSFDGGSEVCNIVVRDIWNRSRLPPEVLEEVYALVDRKGEGALGKEEFVVGLWLIDQRLKGRKLPIRVSESVWRSVGILGAIKVKKIK